ncbi:ribose ABC transporter (permease) [Candidatus Hydrogenisulfobacillus filiaventi]|uniref:Ribose ABC transporter (Permease) n=1 Tax=Candidatus Hydrogenisulfobacillus filiaventi TaxID=2707344 RepID=A0A6F8ZFV1_9FIRM|nr:ABC transporter permease [Bacillota bacterium]CAB1128342.1 ribose ABC transporter (permease) [Candidatus Hydrogenisulfobacillus filiaventi]
MLPVSPMPGPHPEGEDRPRAAAGWWRKSGRLLGQAPILVGFLALVVALSFLSPYFLTVSNWLQLIMQTSMMALVAMGETVVILTGGIDLSSGPTVGLAGMIGAGLLLRAHTGAPVALVASLAVGLLMGLVNGLSVTRLKMAPFIVTLATGSMASGLTLAYSRGNTLAPVLGPYAYLGGGTLAGIPVPVLLTLAVFAGLGWVLARTVWGRQVYAVGGNRTAAYLAGIDVQRTELSVYVLAGLLYAVAGIVETGMLGAATASAGQNLVLTPIAAVVIGGVSLFGGLGSLWGTFLGAITLGVLTNGLDLLNVSPFYAQVVYGLVVFLAVLMDVTNRKRQL